MHGRHRGGDQTSDARATRIFLASATLQVYEDIPLEMDHSSGKNRSNENPPSRNEETTSSSAVDSLSAPSGSCQSPDSQTQKRVKIYPERINRVRAKKPKSRTGCRTCKIRRVKCDEGKPTCQKCDKFGVSCDGYLEPLPTVTPKSSRKALLPNHDCALHVSILPLTALFQDPEEYQYFIYFRDEISHDLSGHAPGQCWNYNVLQACSDNIAVRHLTVAIAALNKSKYFNTTSEKHHQYAMKRYGKALRGIQELVSARNDLESVRTTLIASLLIFIFETTYGNTEQAIVHAKASLKLMRLRLGTPKHEYSHLRRLASLPGLEDEVVAMFVRLDSTIMSRVGNPHDVRKSVLDFKFVDGNKYMPHEFRDFAEAKCYLEHFQYRAMPYLARLADVFLYGDQYATPVTKDAYFALILQLRQWYSSFRPLFERASRPEDKDFVKAAAIRCLALSTDISVQRVCLQTNNRPIDAFEKEARELVALTRAVVQDHRFKKTMGFDCGVVPSLFIAIVICRNRKIREEAIEVLRMAEGRIEVLWDASQIATLGESLLLAEDQGQILLRA